MSRARADLCPICGSSMESRTPQARYCSPKCYAQRNHDAAKMRREAELREANPFRILPGDSHRCERCGSEFTARKPDQRYCGADCRYWEYRKVGPAAADGTWTLPCPDCSTPTKSRISRPRRCRECRVKHDRAKDRRKHAKRGSNLLTVHEIAERDGTRCHICRKTVDMSLSGNHRMGPTVEHILCHSWPGFDPTDEWNEVLAHRACNSARGNRKPSQMVLAFMEA